ncbi:MAG: tetratricopeptide repeat protein, partial [Saprospiraceae bacterium]|nr:tetratricopeptide repeat protein [Saprospiraceae bacterium]
MKKSTRLLVFFCCFCFSAWGQMEYSLADTSLANQWLKESKDLYSRRQYDSAFDKADSAQVLFEQVFGKETKEVADALYQKTVVLRPNRKIWKDFPLKIAQAIPCAEKALAIRLKLYGEMHTSVAEIYHGIGEIYDNIQQDHKAIDYFEKAINIRLKILGEDDLDLANSYFRCARPYALQARTNEALAYLDKALAIRTKKLGEEHFLIAEIYDSKGFACWMAYDNILSLKNYQKAKDIYLKWYGNDNPLLSKTYFGCALQYIELQEYDKAILYCNNALKVNKSFKDIWFSAYTLMIEVYIQKKDYEKAYSLAQKGLESIPQNRDNYFVFTSLIGNLISIYNAMEDYNNEIIYHQKCLDLEIDIGGLQDKWVARRYEHIGEAYIKKNDWNKAIENIQKALAIDSVLYDLDSYYIGGCYEFLGLCYENKRQYDSALFYWQKAIKISEKILGSGHPYLADGERALARIAEKKNDFVNAKTHYEKALAVLLFEGEQHLNKVISVPSLINNLEAKAAFERRLYHKTNDLSHLDESFKTYQQAFAALDYQNRQFNTAEAKTDQKRNRYALYEGAIETNLLLKTSTNLQEAFTFSEKSKASLLQSQLKESNALRFANIPDSLLEYEKHLRLNITDIEKRRQERMSEGNSETDSLNLELSSRADSLRTLYADLKKTFEQNYPDYYRLKYNNKTIDVTEVQQKLLSKEQTLLSYFVGDSAVYAFLVRPDTFAVFDFKKDFPLESWVKQLRDGLYGYHTAEVKTEKLYDMKADSFTNAAFQLQQKLIAPLSNLLTREVVIVPDGVLGYVPFDVLLTEQPKDALKF